MTSKSNSPPQHSTEQTTSPGTWILKTTVLTPNCSSPFYPSCNTTIYPHHKLMPWHHPSTHNSPSSVPGTSMWPTHTQISSPSHGELPTPPSTLTHPSPSYQGSYTIYPSILHTTSSFSHPYTISNKTGKPGYSNMPHGQFSFPELSTPSQPYPTNTRWDTKHQNLTSYFTISNPLHSPIPQPHSAEYSNGSGQNLHHPPTQILPCMALL